MTEQEKYFAKMKHKAGMLKVRLERLELAIIDKNEYNISNELWLMKREIENNYDGMEIKRKQVRKWQN